MDGFLGKDDEDDDGGVDDVEGLDAVREEEEVLGCRAALEDGSGDGGCGFRQSRSWIRRSTITLALRIDTDESVGWRWMGMETRSSGPIGVRGEFTEYRIRGARGLVVS